MRALFNYRWHHLPQFCWWFGELSSRRRAVEFPQPSWLLQCQLCLLAHHTQIRIQSLDEVIPWCPPDHPSLLRPLPREQEGKCWKRETGNDQMFWPFAFSCEWLWLKIYIKSFQSNISRQSFLIFCFELSLFWNLPTFWKMKENGSCQTTRERTLKPK